MSEVHLYVGPTAHGLAPHHLCQPWLRLWPPVRRGDIDRLIAREAKPGVLVVCDGVFQSAPAVSHAELCAALDAGWRVWGVSSIGAIRAFEMRHEGVHGFGHVYAMFRRHADLADDEMCLLHYPEPPYFPVSEPLVNLRFAFGRQSRALGIDAGAAESTIEALRALWFGDRTLAQMRSAMVDGNGIAESKADALLDWMVGHRVKTLDLLRLITQQPWRNPGLPTRAPGSGRIASLKPRASR